MLIELPSMCTHIAFQKILVVLPLCYADFACFTMTCTVHVAWNMVYATLGIAAHMPFSDAIRQGLDFKLHCMLLLQQHQYLNQMSPSSPMYASSSLASAASMFHMSQSSGSPNYSYPYSHWYWPAGHSPLLPHQGPFMQPQYSASHTFSSGKQAAFLQSILSHHSRSVDSVATVVIKLQSHASSAEAEQFSQGCNMQVNDIAEQSCLIDFLSRCTDCSAFLLSACDLKQTVLTLHCPYFEPPSQLERSACFQILVSLCQVHCHRIGCFFIKTFLHVADERPDCAATQGCFQAHKPP